MTANAGMVREASLPAWAAGVEPAVAAELVLPGVGELADVEPDPDGVGVLPPAGDEGLFVVLLLEAGGVEPLEAAGGLEPPEAAGGVEPAGDEEGLPPAGQLWLG